MNNRIVIQDWAGNVLFRGDCNSPKVDKVLDANRCTACDHDDDCDECNGTGYSGDFEIYWEDNTDQRNVYEHVNY